MKKDSLVLSPLCVEDRFPHQGKAFVEAELLPHLKTLLAAERAALDQAMDAPVRETILVAVFVKST